MKRNLILLPIALLLAVSAKGQTKQPDTTKRPKVYWSDLLRIQNLNNELSRRIHKLDIPALRRDTLDMLSSEIGAAIPFIYSRTYADTVKVKGKVKP